MANNRFTVYCVRQSRYNGKRTLPDEKVEGVTAEEMPGLISSNRFVTEERYKEILAERALAKEEEEAEKKAAAPAKAEKDKDK